MGWHPSREVAENRYVHEIEGTPIANERYRVALRRAPWSNACPKGTVQPPLTVAPPALMLGAMLDSSLLARRNEHRQFRWRRIGEEYVGVVHMLRGRRLQLAEMDELVIDPMDRDDRQTLTRGLLIAVTGVQPAAMRPELFAELHARFVRNLHLPRAPRSRHSELLLNGNDLAQVVISQLRSKPVGRTRLGL